MSASQTAGRDDDPGQILPLMIAGGRGITAWRDSGRRRRPGGNHCRKRTGGPFLDLLILRRCDPSDHKR